MTAYVTDPAYGYSQVMNITASQTLKIGTGMVATVIVNTAPTTSGGIYDAASTGTAAAANLICALPITGTGVVLKLQWGVTNGITVLLSGGTPAIAVSYS